MSDDSKTEQAPGMVWSVCYSGLSCDPELSRKLAGSLRFLGPVHDETITPAMIDAGSKAAAKHILDDVDCERLDELARKVYTAMLLAKLHVEHK